MNKLYFVGFFLIGFTMKTDIWSILLGIVGCGFLIAGIISTPTGKQ